MLLLHLWTQSSCHNQVLVKQMMKTLLKLSKQGFTHYETALIEKFEYFFEEWKKKILCLILHGIENIYKVWFFVIFYHM